MSETNETLGRGRPNSALAAVRMRLARNAPATLILGAAPSASVVAVSSIDGLVSTKRTPKAEFGAVLVEIAEGALRVGGVGEGDEDSEMNEKRRAAVRRKPLAAVDAAASATRLQTDPRGRLP